MGLTNTKTKLVPKQEWQIKSQSNRERVWALMERRDGEWVELGLSRKRKESSDDFYHVEILDSTEQPQTNLRLLAARPLITSYLDRPLTQTMVVTALAVLFVVMFLIALIAAELVK